MGLPIASGKRREFIGITATTDYYYTANMHHSPQRVSQDTTWSQAVCGLVALGLCEMKVLTFHFSITLQWLFKTCILNKSAIWRCQREKQIQGYSAVSYLALLASRNCSKFVLLTCITAAEQVQGRSGRHIQVGKCFDNFGKILKAAQLKCLKSAGREYDSIEKPRSESLFRIIYILKSFHLQTPPGKSFWNLSCA